MRAALPFLAGFTLLGGSFAIPLWGGGNVLHLFHMSRVFDVDGSPEIGTIEGFRPMVQPEVCSLSSPKTDSLIFFYNSTAAYLFLVSTGHRSLE